MCNSFRKNKNKRVIRKMKINLKFKKKLLMKRKKKKVHLLMRNKPTKLNKGNLMFKMLKIQILSQINLISI